MNPKCNRKTAAEGMYSQQVDQGVFLKGRFWCRGEVPGRRQGLVGEKQRKLLLGVLKRSVPEKKQCVRKVNIENM